MRLVFSARPPLFDIRPLPGCTPIAAFAAFANDPDIAFLDSAGDLGPRSRYCTLGVMPRHTLCATVPHAGIWQDLRRTLAGMPAICVPGVPFASGAIGHIGFGMAASLENVPVQTASSLNLPVLHFGFYDVVLNFDRQTGDACLISSGTNASARADQAMARLSAPPAILPPLPALKFTEDISQSAYVAAIARVLSYINAGDIYQANFTTRFSATRPPGFSPSSAYLALRARSPAPFGAYLALPDGAAIASVSPERFVQLGADGKLTTRPIKGTRPRGATPAQDDALAADLADSRKDRAENLMIVDLLRNDFSRVAAPGSVAVPTLFDIEIFASVIHMVSEITANLREGCDAIDVLRAVFPGGSVTGAPKIRALEIIHELEIADRGPYCGAIVALASDGAMDSSIAIRTVSIGRDTIAANAGGGIVADSVPLDEYQEMRLKIDPLLRALS